MLFDIAKEIDSLIEKFPGNRELQEKLGVLPPEGRLLESLADVPWDEFDLTIHLRGLLRIILQRDLQEKISSAEEDRERVETTQAVMNHTNRILMLRLLNRAREQIIPDIPREILKLYLETANPGYVEREMELIKKLILLLERDIKEGDAIQELLNNWE